MNSIRITLISLFVASSSYAEEIVKFISLDACKAYYAKSVTPVANETADTYCKNRIMSFVEACTATKIAEFVKAQKLNSFSDLSDTEQRTKKVNFTYQCQATQQNEVAGNAHKAAQARAVSSTTSAEQPQQQANTPVTNNTNIKDGVTPAAAPTKDAATPAANTTAAQPVQAVTPAPTAQTAASTPAAAPAAPPKVDDFSELSKESLDKYTAETAAAKKAAAADAADVGKITPELGDKAKELSTKADGGGASAPATQITKKADAATSELQKNVTTAVSEGKPLSIKGGAPPFSQASETLNSYKSKVDWYYRHKDICKASAETAQFLCAEGTSPGAIVARELMNSAGPVLAVISSAQKTCSSTAKVTKMVNTGLVIARGACIAAKLTCDYSCGKAKADITKVGVDFKAKYVAAVQADYAAAQQECTRLDAQAASDYGASTPLATACHNDLEAKQSTAQAVGPKMQAALESEASVKPGTSPEIAVTCTSMAKDIALFAVQAAGTYAAYQNAKACEEKLAASGAGASTITTQQYCEKSENTSSQICVCQKNPAASGCPGAIVADSSASKDGSSENGTNIKGVGGNSGFAGGFGVKPPSSKASLDKDGVNAALAGAGSPTSTGDGALGGDSGGGLSGSGGAGLGAGSGGAAETAALKKSPEEKKKWGFGAFQLDMGGSGGVGSAGAAKFKSGALTASDQAALQRQIASEKFAAEVSTASGKSNWEKVRNMYLIKENSFIGQ